MIRKVGIAVGLVVLCVGLGWKLIIPSRASAPECTFESRPDASLWGTTLHVNFMGRKKGDLVAELKRASEGPLDGELRGLSADVTFIRPVEPGTFRIEGQLERMREGSWSFEPSPGHSPRISSAGIAVGGEFSGGTEARIVTGTVTIERVNETELVGRLDLRGDQGARISSPFVAKVHP